MAILKAHELANELSKYSKNIERVKSILEDFHKSITLTATNKMRIPELEHNDEIILQELGYTIVSIKDIITLAKIDDYGIIDEVKEKYPNLIHAIDMMDHFDKCVRTHADCDKFINQLRNSCISGKNFISFEIKELSTGVHLDHFIDLMRSAGYAVSLERAREPFDPEYITIELPEMVPTKIEQVEPTKDDYDIGFVDKVNLAFEALKFFEEWEAVLELENDEHEKQHYNYCSYAIDLSADFDHQVIDKAFVKTIWVNDNTVKDVTAIRMDGVLFIKKRYN